MVGNNLLTVHGEPYLQQEYVAWLIRELPNNNKLKTLIRLHKNLKRLLK